MAKALSVEDHPVTVEEIIESKRRRRMQARLQIIGYCVVFLIFLGIRTHDTRILNDYTKCNETRRNAYLAADLAWKRALGNAELDLAAKRIDLTQWRQRRLSAYRTIFKFLDEAKSLRC